MHGATIKKKKMYFAFHHKSVLCVLIFGFVFWILNQHVLVLGSSCHLIMKELNTVKHIYCVVCVYFIMATCLNLIWSSSGQ